MKKLVLVLVLSLPLMVSAENGNPIRKNFSNWINNNIVYPSESIKNHEEGVVYVSFTISENGQAENVSIEEGISFALNKEALLMVNTMPLTAMYEKNDPTKMYILPIKFTLK